MSKAPKWEKWMPSPLPPESEAYTPEGYVQDTHVETIHWDGKADVDLYFKDARLPGLFCQGEV